ncbi:Sporulation related domain-containing protein [Mesonia phycicola]|uniref:Sporulation related domain-containing protein n=1 Tax=Mesonia phycicola TaxID=579105 RepID=A0A1M6ECK3_9FLAO|nr:SPOR domain-containing protein [Mesonia phycicola]SHI83153.1 Sporulation related domain-containing protein [Mesonia phycicola]
MRVEQYLQELLYRYECVVMPGFGAFLAQRKSAEIHETTHAFYPPKKVISFNKQLSENDGVLTNYIAKAENISYSEASEKVVLFVQELQSTLNAYQEIVLKEIGTFSLEEGKVLFQPFYHNNYLAESFGLSTFTSPVIEREEEIVEEVAHVLAKVEETIASEKENDTSTISEEISAVEEEKEQNKTPIWRYAAVGVIALGIAGLLGSNYYVNTIEEHNIAEQQKAEQQIESQIQEATFMISNPLPEVTFKVARENGNYHIVAGAFREKENAAKKVEQLIQKGFNAREIGTNKYGLHQVIYSSHEDRLQALETLRTIKSTENQEAWLLVQEL